MDPETAIASPGPEELARVLESFVEDPTRAGKELRSLRDSDPQEFIRLALAQLGDHGTSGPAANHLPALLTELGYVEVLTDPDQMRGEAALGAALVMARVDAEFYRKLMEMRGSRDPRRVLRILQFIERDEQAMALIPWLRDLVDGGNARLESKAAMILCRLTKNTMVLEKFLRSSDPRVRANAVEGLWGVGNASRTRDVLRRAANDGHHRVAANALVELYRKGDRFAREKIEELARRPEVLFRVAITWAIGEIGDPYLLPIVLELEQDATLRVRLRAGRTAKALQLAAIVEAPTPAAPAVPPVDASVHIDAPAEARTGE